MKKLSVRSRLGTMLPYKNWLADGFIYYGYEKFKFTLEKYIELSVNKKIETIKNLNITGYKKSILRKKIPNEIIKLGTKITNKIYGLSIPKILKNNKTVLETTKLPSFRTIRRYKFMRVHGFFTWDENNYTSDSKLKSLGSNALSDDPNLRIFSSKSLIINRYTNSELIELIKIIIQESRQFVIDNAIKNKRDSQRPIFKNTVLYVFTKD